jgi:hypothetical protein
MRRFTAQADRDSSVETANNIYKEGIEFDSLLFWITELAVGGKVGKGLDLKRSFGFDWICLCGKMRMAGDKTEHSDSDIFRFDGSEHFLEHFSVRILPAGMQDAGVDSETDAIAVILAASGGVDSFIEVGGVKLILADCLGAIDAPGDNCLIIGFYGKKVIDITTFGKQHKKRVGEPGKEINKHRREVCNVVESEGVEHFAHIKADFVQRAICEFGDLLKHCVVVYVDFDEGVMFAIDKRQIAICAAVRAAVGDGDKLVVRPAAKTGAEFAVEFVNERRGVTNHKSSLAFGERPAEGISSGWDISLSSYGFDLCGWEKPDDSLCLAAFGDFFPK